MLVRLILFCATLFTIVASHHKESSGSRNKCNYQSCPKGKPGMLNVHIVAHTHNDVGWLKTVDQYYYGARNDIARAGVQYILDSVVNELIHDQNKRFIYVETAFFWRWWSQQSDSTRHQVQQLVRNGQLEFIGGGWCQNDEAATHYNAVIDQMTWGLRRLTDSFGACGVPRTIWQIDPFGHSKEQASLFAQMYFDALFLGRIDYQDKETRINTTTMEFMWKGSNSLGKEADIFTGILPNNYSPPNGFCFDLLCNDEPIMDDRRLMGYNVDERVNEFLNIVHHQAKEYATNNIIITMGNDFNYQGAASWFKNLDKLIKYVNAQQSNGSKVEAFYSTPSCYAYSLNQANKTWGTKSDDFFPYSSDPHAFWTGYFTSRPALKGYIRQTNNFLQVCKQMDTLARLGPMDNTDVTTLREAMGVAQHHDAVTGTEKQAVAYDYAERIAKGVAACQDTVNDAYKKLMKNGTNDPPKQIFCNLLNISQCHITEKEDSVAVTVYNPIARPVSTYVRLPVIGKAYKVISPNGSSVEAQIVPIPASVIAIPGRESNATDELVFKVDLPPLGYATYFMKKSNNPLLYEEQKSRVIVAPTGPISIQNEFIAAVVNGDTGLLQSVHWVHGISVNMNQSFYYYRGMAGNNSKFEFRASGAYIFRPNGTQPQAVSDKAQISVVKGTLVEEIHQAFNPWVTQVIRVYKGSYELEFDWLVGPIPIDDKVGKEVISRFDTHLKTNGTFFTDANGREMQKRIRNYRPSWNLILEEPVSGNYYPINSRIFMQDVAQNQQFTVLTDRSQGGSSIKDGSLELMVHRRLLHDDAFGVGEALNETGFNNTGGLIVRGKHYLQITRINDAAVKHRDLAERIFMAPYVSFAAYSGSEQSWMADFKTKFSGVSRRLPDNVHLLTLEQWKGNSILLRLEHFYELHEDPSHMSKPATVSLQALFTSFKIKDVLETTLGANQLLKTAHRLPWQSVEGRHPDNDDHHHEFLRDFTITLNPMQIRTFIVIPDEALD